MHHSITFISELKKWIRILSTLVIRYHLFQCLVYIFTETHHLVSDHIKLIYLSQTAEALFAWHVLFSLSLCYCLTIIWNCLHEFLLSDRVYFLYV